MVYENLLSLKGMNQKVMEVIEHNEELFRRRLQMDQKALKQKALDAWVERVKYKRAVESKVRRAMNKILKGALARTFYAWRDEYHLTGERGWRARGRRGGGWG